MASRGAAPPSPALWLRSSLPSPRIARSLVDQAADRPAQLPRRRSAAGSSATGQAPAAAPAAARRGAAPIASAASSATPTAASAAATASRRRRRCRLDLGHRSRRSSAPLPARYQLKNPRARRSCGADGGSGGAEESNLGVAVLETAMLAITPVPRAVRKSRCGREDSNPHGLREHHDLNLACIPIPPRPRMTDSRSRVGRVRHAAPEPSRPSRQRICLRAMEVADARQGYELWRPNREKAEPRR